MKKTTKLRSEGHHLYTESAAMGEAPPPAGNSKKGLPPHVCELDVQPQRGQQYTPTDKTLVAPGVVFASRLRRIPILRGPIAAEPGSFTVGATELSLATSLLPGSESFPNSGAVPLRV